MNAPKITDGEYNVLDVLWDNGPLQAVEIVKILNQSIGWNRNTTYTFINRLVGKCVISRTEPGFLCTPLYTRGQIGVSETRTLLERMFGGSLRTMMAGFLNEQADADEIRAVRQMISDWEAGSGANSHGE